MTVAVTDFTSAFPEFNDFTKYPPGQISFWLGQAYSTLNAHRFGTNLDLAAMLYTAHNIVLSARAAATAASSGIVGEATGPTASKSVGPVSIGYDVGAAAIAGAGIYNSTSYGQRFIKICHIVGAGGLYIPGNSYRTNYNGIGRGYPR